METKKEGRKGGKEKGGRREEEIEKVLVRGHVHLRTEISWAQ